MTKHRTSKGDLKERRFKGLYSAYERLSDVSAKDSNSIVYLPKELVKGTIPYKNQEPDVQCFVRRDGNREFRMIDVSGKGLPYGIYPRLILPLINRQAIINKSRDIAIAKSITDLLRSFGIKRTGGERGTITIIKHQIECLLRCAYWFGESGQEIENEHFFKIPNGYIESGKSLFSLKPRDKSSSVFTLDEHYYHLVTQNPVPLDFRALQALKFSPLAMDVYCWVSFKSFSGKGKRNPFISDHSLMQQFGCSYKSSDEFKRYFKEAFSYVQVLYPEAEVEFQRGRTKVISTTPHIPP